MSRIAFSSNPFPREQYVYVRWTVPSLVGMLSLVGIALLLGCTRREQVGLSPGDYPPPFQLQSTTGDWISLKDLRGKTVLINFWATWCAPCVEEMPAMERMYQKLQNRGVEVVAIAVDDDPQTVRSFKNRYGLTFPILLDQKGTVRDSYRVEGYPESFVVSPQGKLRLVLDPVAGKVTARIVGPRPWDSDAFQQIFQEKTA